MKRTACIVAIGAFSVGLAVGCKSLPPSTPIATLNPTEAHGHAVYQARCAVCHYDRQSGVLHGPALDHLFKKEYLPSGAPANDERVTATIVHGRNTMPPMGQTMDQQDLEDLLAYLHSL